MSNFKKLMMTSAGGGEVLNVEDVFSTYLYTGDYNTGTLNQHIKNNVPLSNFGTGGTSVNFDGGDYLTRADFSGNTDGKEITFSAWILFNDFENNFVFSSDPNGGGSGVNVGYYTGKLRFQAYNTLGSVISQWRVDDSNTPFHQWFHLCFSVNTASGVGATKVYINDVAATTESLSNSNQNIDRTRTAQRLAVRGTDYKLTGNLAHVFMDYTYRDLDIESNRRLFIDANGGSTDPSTLSALNPIMYCPLTDDYTMGKNLGTGGDFTSSGNPAFSTLGTQATADTSEGGMVWIKNRSSIDSHVLFDTERGAPKLLSSNTSDAEVTNNPDTLTQFLADGFFIGDDVAVNTSNEDYASWTFRKAPKFFDVVTYTGNGVAGRTVSHNLGSVPGMLVVKSTSNAGSWQVYHRGVGDDTPEKKYLTLNGTASFNTGSSRWNDTAPTDTEFTLGNDTGVNANGYTYVAYLFAHNDGDGEFGPDGDADIIKCGSYTGNGSNANNGTVVDLGFEPQWLMVKNADGTGDWVMVDTMRGFPGAYAFGSLYAEMLHANENISEDPEEWFKVLPNGFQLTDSATNINSSGSNYIYIAIRRGTKVPESGTEVFAVDTGSDNSFIPTGHVVDAYIGGVYNASNTYNYTMASRLTGRAGLITSNANAEISNWLGTSPFDYNDGMFPQVFASGAGINYSWKRAPGFFDVVAYTGDGVAGRTVSHNLGVAPEMMWVKERSQGNGWQVYHASLPNTSYMQLNTDGVEATSGTGRWNSTDPTDSVFTLGSDTRVNNSNSGYIAYLFTTLDGISKVGSYTGNGTSQTIDCGFTSGARFVLIKSRGQGNWIVYDSERGIVSGNDPALFLNTTDAEDSGHDQIDPASSGFTVVYDSFESTLRLTNKSGVDYIFYAIA